MNYRFAADQVESAKMISNNHLPLWQKKVFADILRWSFLLEIFHRNQSEIRTQKIS